MRIPRRLTWAAEEALVVVLAVLAPALIGFLLWWGQASGVLPPPAPYR